MVGQREYVLHPHGSIWNMITASYRVLPLNPPLTVKRMGLSGPDTWHGDRYERRSTISNMLTAQAFEYQVLPPIPLCILSFSIARPPSFLAFAAEHTTSLWPATASLPKPPSSSNDDFRERSAGARPWG